MIKYLKYANDLKKVVKFKHLLEQFCEFQNEVEKEYLKQNRDFGFISSRGVQILIQKRCTEKNQKKYKLMRVALAEQIPTISRIAHHLGVQLERYSHPSHIGGPIISVNILQSVLEDNGYIPTLDETRYDALNKISGILKETKKHALINSFNPLSLLSFILRLPFLLIQQTGLNIEKIENELIGKIFKLLFLLALAYGLLALGFTHDQITHFK